jgi:hypothetical protein
MIEFCCAWDYWICVDAPSPKFAAGSAWVQDLSCGRGRACASFVGTANYRRPLGVCGEENAPDALYGEG